MWCVVKHFKTNKHHLKEASDLGSRYRFHRFPRNPFSSNLWVIAAGKPNINIQSGKYPNHI